MHIDLLKMEQLADTPQHSSSLFVGTDVSAALALASQSQAILMVCIQGNTEEDEKIENELWQNSEVKELLKDCICLRLLDGADESAQFKEYYKVTQTPTIYFFGMKQSTLLVIEGYITFEQFSEKFSLAKEQFSKQVNDLKQIMQLLLLQQLQNQTQNPTTAQTNIPSSNASNTVNTSNNVNTNNNTNANNNNTKNRPNLPATNVSNNKPAFNNNQNKNVNNNSNVNNNTVQSTTSTKSSTAAKTTPSSTKPTSSPSSPSSSSNSATPKNVKLNSNTSPVAAKPPERHVTSLAFRLTNGQVIKAQFSPYDTLSAAIEYVDKNRTDGKHKYVLMTTFPKKVFSVDDYESTLTQLDLVPSSTLVLVATDPNAKPIPYADTPTTQTTPSSSSYPSTPSPSSSSSSSSGGMLSSVSNYVWSFFGSAPSSSNSNPNSSEPASKKNGSFWEYNYDSKKEEAVRNNTAQDPETSSVGIRNRRNVHQLNDTSKKDDKDENNYWNGNSTQFQ